MKKISPSHLRYDEKGFCNYVQLYVEDEDFDYSIIIKSINKNWKYYLFTFYSLKNKQNNDKIVIIY